MLEISPTAFRELELPTPFLASEYAGGLDHKDGWRLLRADLAFLEAKMAQVRVRDIIDGIGGLGLPLTERSYERCRTERPRSAADERRCRAHTIWYLALVDAPDKKAWVRKKVDVTFVKPLRGVDLHTEDGVKEMREHTKVRPHASAHTRSAGRVPCSAPTTCPPTAH